MASVVSRSFVTCPSARMRRMWYCAGVGAVRVSVDVQPLWYLHGAR